MPVFYYGKYLLYPYLDIKVKKNSREKFYSFFSRPNQLDIWSVVMGKEELSIPGTIVKKSNSIIRTRITIKDVEGSRILAHLIACIRTDDVQLKEAYAVSAKDILPHVGGGDYRRIKATCRELTAAFAETEEPDPDGAHPIFRARPFFTDVTYRKGIIAATFNPLMRPFLLELQGCFTTYNLAEYLALPSLYSQRIFEVVKSLANSKGGEAIVSMSDLHRFLDTPKSIKNNFAEFRRGVLDKAYKDIHEKTQLRFEWEAVKAGRSVEKIRFIFGGGRKALAQKELDTAKEEKKRRLQGQRMLMATDCAKAKAGDCRTMDNKPIVCKLCRDLQIAEGILRNGGKPFNPYSGLMS